MKTTATAKNHPLVGPEEVSKALNVSRNTVLNWANRGEIPCIKIGKTFRFSLKKISEAIGHDLIQC